MFQEIVEPVKFVGFETPLSTRINYFFNNRKTGDEKVAFVFIITVLRHNYMLSVA
jgi:hypothetical protein